MPSQFEIPYIDFARLTRPPVHTEVMKPWILCAVFLSVALGQETGKIAFEVASIKPANPMPMGQVQIGMKVDGSLLQYSNVSLKECIRAAYRVKDFQVEGPDWLGSARFDIVAKLPEGSPRSQVPEMLQALRAERFKLALHRDSREQTVYAMVVAKGGAKLKPAELAPPGDPRRVRMRAAVKRRAAPSRLPWIRRACISRRRRYPSPRLRISSPIGASGPWWTRPALRGYTISTWRSRRKPCATFPPAAR